MPKGTRVHRCVDKVKKSGRKGVNPYAVCQASTDQSYATGKTIKEDRKEDLKTLSSKRSTKASRKARKEAGGSPKENVARKKSSGYTRSSGERVMHVTGGRNNPKVTRSSGRLLGATAGLNPKQKRQMQKDLIQRGSVSDSREYKRIGILIAEAMGYRVDELVGALVGGLARGAGMVARGAGKVAGGVVKGAGKVAKKAVTTVGKKAANKVADKAANKVADMAAEREDMAEALKLKLPRVSTNPARVSSNLGRAGRGAKIQRMTRAQGRRELAAQAASDTDLEENKMNNKYINALVEMHRGHPSSSQEKLRKELGDDSYEKLSTDRSGTTPVKAAADRKGTRSSKRTRGVSSHGKKRNPTPTQQNSWTEYQRLGKIIAETEFPKGPTAKRYGALGRAKEGASKIKDPLVKKEVAKTKANIDKKTKSKTNPKVSDLVQGSMNRRRGESRRGKGPSGLPQETKKEAQADAKRDTWRRMAPGDK